MKKKLNQQKLKLSKQHKRFAITVLILLLLVNIGLIINEVTPDKLSEESRVVSSFSSTPGVSYQVYLNNNALYSDPVQPEDIGYFSSLIDHIDVTFNNQYKGSGSAEYRGDYTITGEIIGLEAGTEEFIPAWTKQFGISSKKTFSTTDDELKFSKTASIDYHHFSDFVSEIEELTEYHTIYIMKVIMAVNYTISTADGDVTGTLQPSLIIPLGESYFKIAKSDIEEINDDISATIEVPVPVNYAKIILISTISIFCLLLLFLCITSVEPTSTELQRKKIKKIMKSHGNRIVAIENDLICGNLEVCYVHAMSDMVKVSDEIERPIFYGYRDDPAEIREFFILDRERVYVYQTVNSASQDELPESNEKNSQMAS